MKKWIAAILTLVMLTQALPWTAFAEAIAAGQMITDKELQRALQIAGLQTVSGGVSANAEGSGPFRLEAKESGYHAGMKPNETWDAQMLMDWLDDTLTRAIYNVINVYTRTEAILERLKDEDPAAYAELVCSLMV